MSRQVRKQVNKQKVFRSRKQQVSEEGPEGESGLQRRDFLTTGIKRWGN